MTKISEGLDLDNLEQMTSGELEHNLLHVWDWRGSLYEMGANSLMLDYMPPQFAKAHRWGSDFFGRPDLENIALLGIGTLAAYLILDWETGILNQFQVLRRNGMTKQQIMEIVLFVQLYGGMRQLGHVYRSVGDMLPMFAEPSNPPRKLHASPRIQKTKCRTKSGDFKSGYVNWRSRTESSVLYVMSKVGTTSSG